MVVLGLSIFSEEDNPSRIPSGDCEWEGRSYRRSRQSG